MWQSKTHLKDKSVVREGRVGLLDRAEVAYLCNGHEYDVIQGAAKGYICFVCSLTLPLP